jgi:hypothetical protein
VTKIDLRWHTIDYASNRSNIDALLARNNRLRHLFIFDARQMLLSLMCSDECGVVWPYLLEADNRDVGVSSDNVAALRAEFAAVVEERRRRAAAAARLVAADDSDEGDIPAVKRRRTNRR